MLLNAVSLSALLGVAAAGLYPGMTPANHTCILCK